MDINARTKIFSLIDEHPHLLDFLAEYDPSLAKLKNPELRIAMRDIATLQLVSEHHGHDLQTFVNDIKNAVEKGAETKGKEEINANTKIFSLIEKHPQLLDFLAGYDPSLAKLKNPELQNAMRDIATLQLVSEHHGHDLNTFVNDVRNAIEHGVEIKSKPSSNLPVDQGKVDTLKKIIKGLHSGEDVESVKQKFATLAREASPAEIAEMEQQLIGEGMSMNDIKPLCDVHAAVFRESLENQDTESAPPGHPVHTYMAENLALEDLIGRIRFHLKNLASDEKVWDALAEEFGKLYEVEKHYVRKENQLFPHLEENGVTGPSQVMWAIHDDIRGMLKVVRQTINSKDQKGLEKVAEGVLLAIQEMIYKENKILFPMSMELLKHEDWVKVKKAEAEIGYTLVTPGNEWNPRIKISMPGAKEKEGKISSLPLDTGLLSLEQVNLILKHLPVEISFVDEKDEVRYFTGIEHKIFPRSPDVIGRQVQFCHPPKSVHMVNAILGSFRAGAQSHADFWIEMNGRMLYIRYFAVRSESGEYKGCLEVVQDVTDIRRLEGERRLLDWREV
ncbi:DUF438 domain-containing protein [bacterium]|nr:DUF438 domain-containing protein [bacterium]